MPAPIGEVTVMVPMDSRQSGWTVVATGAEGAPGAGSIVTGTCGDIHPSGLFAVTL